MRTMPQSLVAVCFMVLLSAPLPFLSPVVAAQAAALVSADQASGYSGHVLDKISKSWQAPQYPSEHTVRIRVSIDGDGKILGCWPEQSSNLALMDKSACAAVHDAGKFDAPPYGLPINVFLTFWTGTPKGNKPYANAAAGGPDLAQQNADAANAAAMAAARAAEARAATATQGAGAKSAATTAAASATAASAAQGVPGAATQSAQAAAPADPQNRAPLVGVPGEAASADEARYARRIAREIREKMIIPAEIPKGKYTFKMYVHISAKGDIDKSELTQSSGEAVMDKYALRAIKKMKELTVPPTKKSHDLHLTFVVQRP